MHDIGRDASSSYAEDMSDGTWMTYAELAALRRINQASAFKLALRHRWRRQKNNTGQMTVFVPSAWSDTSQDNAHDMSRQTEEFRAGPTAIAVGVLEAAVSTLREQLAAANDRADQAEANRRAAEGRADQADADQRAAIALTDQTVTLLTDAMARADQAEQGRDAERTRVDALADRLHEVQVELAKAEAEGDALTIETAELTAQVKQARASEQAAQNRAEALLQADAARRGRGRLARLRAAWRGE